MSRQLESIVSTRFDAATTEQMRAVAKSMGIPYTVLVRLAVTRFLALPDEWQPRVTQVGGNIEREGGPLDGS